MSDGRQRPGPRRSIALRLAAVATLAAVTLLGAPRAAEAAGTVRPLLDCVVQKSNGTYTAVLGYANDTGSTQSIARGSGNVLWPWNYDGAQPTTFSAGTHHGVFQVTVTWWDLWWNPSWQLDGTTVYFIHGGSSCPAPTELPAAGNGTGPAIGLAVAALVGIVLVRRYARRAGVESPRA